MRLFVGVPLPDDVRTKLWAFWEAHGIKTASVRPVSAENYHITLKFIGEVPESKAKRIETALEQATLKNEFTVHISGIGGFPRNDSAKVVWAGVQEGFQELTVLSEYIDRLLVDEGIPRETKPFHPHVTLARIKRGVADVTTLSRMQPNFGTFAFRKFRLYKSTLTPEGPIYKALRDYEVRP